MDVDLAESAGLPQPRLKFAAEGQYPTVRPQEIGHQLDPRPSGARVAFDLPVHRQLLYREPTPGLDELGDALEDALWFWKLFIAACPSSRSGTLHQKSADLYEEKASVDDVEGTDLPR